MCGQANFFLDFMQIKKKMSRFSEFGNFECGVANINVNKVVANKICAVHGLPQSYAFGGVVPQDVTNDSYFAPNGEANSNPGIFYSPSGSQAVGVACRLVGVSWHVVRVNQLPLFPYTPKVATSSDAGLTLHMCQSVPCMDIFHFR